MKKHMCSKSCGNCKCETTTAKVVGVVSKPKKVTHSFTKEEQDAISSMFMYLRHSMVEYALSLGWDVSGSEKLVAFLDKEIEIHKPIFVSMHSGSSVSVSWKQLRCILELEV